ncbi:hypothetical protein ASPCAL14978 [Aspergillus calidoustus]|uniref:GS catalytic domain-containing protein n=1 Tax=Aspergillus calidoustus TaxID=454130 RepID=A0A0U5GIH6_ASPCI|nr:hypothetical protein ASPCAL14978 [Aspergillus calidoustus]
MNGHAVKAPITVADINNIGLESLQSLQILHPTIRFVRFQWQDLSGVLRGRVSTLSYALQLAKDNKHIRVSPLRLHCIVDNFCSLGRSRSADICPRTAIASTIAKASAQHGVHFLIGFEIEFEAVKVKSRSGDITSASTDFGRYALRDPCCVYVEEAVLTLVDSGISIQEFHSEGAIGQYEITLPPLPLVAAVDTLVFVHDTLKHVFGRYGLHANMSPVSIAGHGTGQGTGQHTYISLNPPLREEYFLAGILNRLQGLCACTLPYDISYRRVAPALAGNVVAWGTQHRQMPVRKINPGHWELRCVDAAANMYFALAAMTGAGMLGIAREKALVWPDMADGAKTSLDLEDWLRLPMSVDEGLDYLESVPVSLKA